MLRFIKFFVISAFIVGVFWGVFALAVYADGLAPLWLKVFGAVLLAAAVALEARSQAKDDDISSHEDKEEDKVKNADNN